VFLTVGLEWMNIGPINETSGGVRPRVQVNAELFGDATKFDQVGIVSNRLSNPKTATSGLISLMLIRLCFVSFISTLFLCEAAQRPQRKTNMILIISGTLFSC
jgi:hypothetical protein